MDRLSKQILLHLNSCCANPSEQVYDFWDDLDSIASKLNTDSETLRAAVRYLETGKYLKFSYASDGKLAMSFYLDHKGLHWKEFRREEILRYLQDKWIDCFSLLVSFAALVISTIALWQKG